VFASPFYYNSKVEIMKIFRILMKSEPALTFSL
jgi:hypothetical protein